MAIRWKPGPQSYERFTSLWIQVLLKSLVVVKCREIRSTNTCESKYFVLEAKTSVGEVNLTTLVTTSDFYVLQDCKPFIGLSLGIEKKGF